MRAFCPQCSLAWPEGAKRCNACAFVWGDKSELWASGIDEALVGIGGDPWHGNTSLGLRVPTASTASLAPGGNPVAALDLRYLFLLAGFILGEEEEATVLGYRMGWELGVALSQGGGKRIVRQPVEDPGFMLPDGNVSWHMMVYRGIASFDALKRDIGAPAAGWVQGVPGIAFRAATQGSLLCESIALPPGDKFYVDLTAYNPPNKGRPYGEPFIDGFGSFQGLRTEERTHGAWNALNAKVKGPGLFGFYASVRQTAGLVAISQGNVPNPFFPNGLSDEEQFISNFDTELHPVKIWRVYGALAVET